MIATAPVYYADNTEARLLEDDRNPSAYVEYMKPKRSIVENDKNYLCKFFIYNGETAEDAEETAAISYFKITQIKAEDFIEDEVDLLRMQAQDEIRAYANFQDDWDGYGAEPISKSSLNFAAKFFKSIIVVRGLIIGWDVSPTGRKTVQVEKTIGDNYYEIEFFDDGKMICSAKKNGKWSGTELKLIQEVVQWVENVVS